MKPGTFVLRKVSVPVKLTASFRSLSSARACPASVICAAAIAAMQAKRTRFPDIHVLSFCHQRANPTTFFHRANAEQIST
jgi:hypothetical protein